MLEPSGSIKKTKRLPCSEKLHSEQIEIMEIIRLYHTVS